MGRIGKDELSPELISSLEKLMSPPDVLKDYYTKEEIDLLITEINNYLDIVLTVDKTYTKEIIDWKLGLISDKLNSIQIIETYTKEQIDTKINSLRKLINTKMDKDTMYTKDEIQRLIDEAVRAAMPDISKFYTKEDVDEKLSGFLTRSDIADTLSNDTKSPVSVNQIYNIEQKIKSLKQSASDGSKKVATAITGIGIDLGSVPTNPWDTYRDAILNFKRKMTAKDYMNQVPDEVMLIKEFNYTDSDVHYTGFDTKYSGNYYVVKYNSILHEYDSNFNLLRSKKIEGAKYDSSYYIMHFSPNLIQFGTNIINRNTLNVVHNTAYEVITILEDDVVIYRTDYKSISGKYDYSVMMGYMENGEFKTEELMNSITSSIGVTYFEIKDKKLLSIGCNVDGDYYSSFVYELKKNNNKYTLSSSVNRYISNPGNFIFYKNMIYSNYHTHIYPEYVTFNNQDRSDINDLNTGVNQRTINTTTDGVSDIIYRMTYGKLIARHMGKLLFVFDTKTELYYNNIYFDTSQNCLYFDSHYTDAYLGVYKITFKPKS